MGATGIGGAGWSDHDLPGYHARRVLRESRDCAQSLFLKYSWKSGGADMLPCVTILKYKGLETLDLELKWCQRLGQDLTGFAKWYLRQRFFLGGGRGAREIDVDVDEGADNAVQRRISHRPSQHLDN